MNYKIIIAYCLALFSCIEQSFGQSPSPDFTARITAGYVELTSTSTNPNSINSYLWDFGSTQVVNAINNQETACVQYLATGTYKVTLYITTTMGGIKIKEKTINMSTLTIPTPNVKFTYSYGASTQEVKFKADVTNSVDCPIPYQWNFGDPSSQTNTSTEKNPTHTYTNTNCTSYVVTLTVGIYSYQ